MSIYKAKLKRREEIAAGTMAFHFEKPEGFIYKAGQYVDYALINPSETDAEGNTRGFSLASAPYEDDLMSATRMRDTAFKRVLKHWRSALNSRWTPLAGPSRSTTMWPFRPFSSLVASA
jgi:ferredoxin-NADP reductase